MITYKNISFSAKTFYGVEFKSGEVKSVPGYINSPSMVRVFNVTPTTNVKANVTEEVTTKRGRKKSSDPEKDSFAELQETKINSEEETSNGNPS